MLDNYLNQLLKLVNSKEYIALENFYKKETVFDILGITRKETCHSNFLKWMMDVNSSHGLGEYSLRKFLELLVTIDKSKIDDEELVKVIVTGAYRLSNVEVNREQMTIDKDGRIDLFIRFKISYNGTKDKVINLIIENKIESGTNGPQLENYEKFSKEITKEHDKTLLIYLYPEYNNSAKHDSYLKVTYQNLVSRVLEPCLTKITDDNVKHLIEEYICSIGLPRIVDNGENNCNYNIIATGTHETELLKSIWEEHNPILKQINNSLFNLIIKKSYSAEDSIVCSFYYSHIAILKPLFKSLDEEETKFVSKELVATPKVNKFNNDKECVDNPELIRKVIDRFDDLDEDNRVAIEEYFAGVPLFINKMNNNRKDINHLEWYQEYKDKWILTSFTDAEIKRFISFLNSKGFSIERYR